MSNEWAHNAARKEVPTVNNLTFGGYAVANTHGSSVPGAGPRGEVRALLAQDRSGITATGTAMRGVVVARPKTQLQKYPFMTCGAAINGALSGPHRAWDPV